MNGDTPGASSADDFEFLGPAISRRQAEPSDVHSGSDEEFAGPFVGRPASGEMPAPGLDSAGGDAVLDGADEERAAGWPDDDLPWLMPVEAGEDDASADDGTPWRATGEVEAEGSGVDWGGDPISLGEMGVEAEVARQGWDDAFGEAVSWDTEIDEAGAEAALDISALQVDAEEGEREGFVVDAEPAGESWSDATREVDGPRGMTGGAEAPWEAGRWDEGEVGGSDGERGAGGWDEGGVGEDAAASEEGGAQAGWAVQGGGGVEGEVGPGDALAEVAERLERVAGALREGRPLEVAMDGDPLQLLVVGYALGYAQARKRGG